MLAPELIQGLKLDINRWLGNGVDDNGNQVIDDYFVDDIAGLGEAAAGEMATASRNRPRAARSEP